MIYRKPSKVKYLRINVNKCVNESNIMKKISVIHCIFSYFWAMISLYISFNFDLIFSNISDSFVLGHHLRTVLAAPIQITIVAIVKGQITTAGPSVADRTVVTAVAPCKLVVIRARWVTALIDWDCRQWTGCPVAACVELVVGVGQAVGLFDRR